MRRAIPIERKAVKPLEVNVFLATGLGFPKAGFDKGFGIVCLAEQADIHALHIEKVGVAVIIWPGSGQIVPATVWD